MKPSPDSPAMAPSTPVKQLLHTAAPPSPVPRSNSVSARSPLFDNIKFLFMYGIVQWHSGQCGQNIRCFPGKEAWLGETPTILNCLPKLVGSACLTGFMLLGGVVYAGRTINLRKQSTVLHVVGMGLFVQYVVATPIDMMLGSRIPTNGHVWFMYALAVARGFVGVCQLASLSRSTITALSVIINLFAALAWHYVPRDQSSYDGLTWSSTEWFDVIGTRWFTFIFYFVVGWQLPADLILSLNQRLHASTRLWRASMALLAVNVVYNLFRLDLRATNLFVSGAPDEWLKRMPYHIEMSVISTLSPILLLCVLPARPIGRITQWGENTLFCYLVHPFGLKLFVKPTMPYLFGAALSLPSPELQWLCLFLLELLVPLLVQVGLCELSIVLKAVWQRWRNRKAAPDAAGVDDVARAEDAKV